MGDVSKIKMPDNSIQNVKDSVARETLETKMPIYTIGTPTVLVDTTTVSFSKDGDNNWYISGENPISLSISSSDVENSIFFIEWDNVEYKLFMKMVEETRPVRSVTGSGYFDWWAIGNISTIGYGSTLADIEAPFAVTVDYMKNAGERYIISYDTAVSHTIKISKASFTKTVCDPAYYADTRYTGYPPIRFTSNIGSVAECGASKSSGNYSHAEGVATVASGDYGSHAEGQGTTASGRSAHAEGLISVASGDYSHAEGNGTTASGTSSHAEGQATTASGNNSHAEGNKTTASGGSSHAEGQRTTASGNLSHVEGEYTIANHRTQHVFGKANIEDPSTEATNKIGNYVEIVGNGTWVTSGSETVITRSNARTLDWSGNEVLAGSVTANGGFIGDLTGNASSATNASTINNLTVEDIIAAITPRTGTVTDQAVATFSDGADNVPMKSITLSINPFQEGSGDPFPPGGCKNLCPPMTGYNTNGLITTVDSDGKINVSGTATGTAGYITNYVNLGKIIPSGTAFSISVTNAPPSTLRAFFDTGVKDIPAGATKAENTTRGNDITKLRLYLFTTEGQSYNFSFYFQIEIGASATSYVPYAYENVRPITGVSSDTIKVADGDNVVQKTYTVQLGDTYYGATLDVVRGKLVCDTWYHTYTTATLYGNYGPDNKPLYYFETDNPIIVPAGNANQSGRLICNYFKKTTGSTSADLKNNEIRTQESANSNRLFFRWDDAASLSDINTVFSTTPLQIILELATPIEIDLTPTQVNTLLGSNNIWHDGNGNISCEYFKTGCEPIARLIEAYNL